MTLNPGAKLGPYEIISPLGAGGMGEVYRAKDSRLGREVAIKVLPESMAQDAEALARFEREAKAVAALSHPNILALHDIGNENGVAYAVMELLEGETLRTRLNAGMIPPRKLTDFARQIAEGLAAAHDKGIIHRDLKPENLWVTADGRMKILDFGLAKVQQSSSAPGSEENSPTRTIGTGAGVTLGTVGYMSPEQVRGEPADHRSDIFSFGAVLYEMASGKRAFKKDSAVETMSAILKEEPPEISLSAAAASGLDRIIRHCLEKKPGERFQSARDMAFDLASLSGATGSGAPIAAEAARKKKLRYAIAVLAGVLLAVLAGAGWLAIRRNQSFPPPEFTRLTFRKGHIYSARFSPDGKTVIYAARFEAGQEPLLQQIRIGSPEPLRLEPAGALPLSLSRCGELAVLTAIETSRTWMRRGTLGRLSLSGGTPRAVADNVQDADWGPDCEQLAIVRNETGRFTLEFPIGTKRYESSGWLSHLRVSPNGKQIAFLDHPFMGDDRGQLAYLDPQGAAHRFPEQWESIQGVAWRAAGDEIWFTAAAFGFTRALYAQRLDGPLRLVSRVPGTYTLQDFAPDGSVLLIHESHQYSIYLHSDNGGADRDLTWRDLDLPVAVSPDGGLLLVNEAGEGAAAGYETYLRPMNGAPAVRLGAGKPLAFSPDGNWILATQLLPLPAQLFLQPTGAGVIRPLPPDAIHHFAGAFLPDGKSIIFIGYAPGRPPRAYIQDIAAGSPRPLTPEGTVGTLNDGELLLVQTTDRKYWLYPISGEPPRALSGFTDDDIPLCWGKDHNLIYFFRVDKNKSSGTLFRYRLDTERLEPWRSFKAYPSPDLMSAGIAVLLPDEASYVYARNEWPGELYMVKGLK